MCRAAKTMRASLTSTIILLVLSSARAFFVDTKDPVTFTGQERSFGHQVVQLDKWVVVSAPLQQTANQTGEIFICDPKTGNAGSCLQLRFPASMRSVDGINPSLGLSLVAQNDSLLTCGPTLQRICGQNIYINGECHQLELNRRTSHMEFNRTNFSPSLPECSVFALDIVFLIDGSGSVATADFGKMLTFVSTVMSSFSRTDAQFALMQYSYGFITHFDFKMFSSVRDPQRLTSGIIQMEESTRTATAIHKVTTELFVPSSGHRDKAAKLLIVITDGETYGDDMKLDVTAAEAKRRGIVCFAIGVGNAFNDANARRELETIASSTDKVLRVNDFSALAQFQKTLQDKIFSIEGTQTKDATSFQMEMSQEGFSAILTQDGPILGAVGAYDWSGGFSVYPSGQQSRIWINSSADQSDMRGAYMGYAMEKVAEDVIAVGAPRYQYIGRVLVYRKTSGGAQWELIAAATGDQIGSYFGSVLSSLPGNDASLLIVGAPVYYSPEVPGGRVYLCSFSTKIRYSQVQPNTIRCSETLQGDSSQFLGHFGSAISVLPDLTGDKLPDLAIGAPYEDNYKGAIYIFAGKQGGFRTSPIQRISGSLSGGLRFFGRSISGNLDMTGDGIPDITAGAEGQVLVMRSRPVVRIDVDMSITPSTIPLTLYDCSSERDSNPKIDIRVCFLQRLRSTNATGGISASVNYTLFLDAGRSQTRALFTRQPDSRTASSTLTMPSNQWKCSSYSILLPECVEDFLTPLRVSLSCSLLGSPVLSEDSKTTYSTEASFQKNCGGDGVCTDNLSIKIAFSDVSMLVVGEHLDVNVTVSVRNEGEDSFNTRVFIPFPSSLSYRLSLIKSDKKATVLCFTLDSQREVRCDVNRPRLRPQTQVDFLVSFHVSRTAALGDSLKMKANVTSDNEGTPNDRMTSSAQVPVLYNIYITVTSLEETSKYQNFSSGDAAIQHVYRVNNLGERSLPLSVIFLVPVRIGEATFWKKVNISSSQPQSTVCSINEETGGAQNFQELINKSPVVNCSVGRCVKAECKIKDLGIQSSVVFTISGTVTKDWTTQTEQKKISIQSTAEVVYDNQTYHQNVHFTRAQTQTVLEVLTAYNYLPAIVGSSVGGLVLLALVTAGLYKLGFFKRQYKDLMEDAGEATAAGSGEASTEPQTAGGGQ